MVASHASKWLDKVTQHEEHGEHKDVLADTSEDNLDFITSKLQTYASRPKILEHHSHMAGSTTHQASTLSLIHAQPS